MSVAQRFATIAVGACLALTASTLTVPASQAATSPPVLAWSDQANPAPVGAGTVAMARAADIATDKSRNAYVAGTFAGQVTFGSRTLRTTNPATDYNAFVVKYSPTGETLWAVRAGGGSASIVGASAIALDRSGNVYVSGAIANSSPGSTVDFGNGVVLTSGQKATNFVVKYSPAGVARWARAIESTDTLQVFSISATAKGRVTFAGLFRGDVTSGGITLTEPASWRGMVGVLSASGATKWLRSISSTSANRMDVFDVAVDAGGSSYVTGQYSEDIDFGDGLTRTRVGVGESPFLVRYAPDGTPVWADGFVDVERGEGRGVAVDRSGNVVLTGSFRGTMSVGSSTIRSGLAAGCFVARYSPDAVGQWAVGCDSTSFSDAQAVTTSGSRVLVVGRTESGTTFGGVPLVPPAGSDLGRSTGFVAELSGSGTVLWADVITATPRTYTDITGVAVGAGRQPIVAGEMEGSISIGGQVLTSPLGVSGPDLNDMYVAAYADAPTISPDAQSLFLSVGEPMTPSEPLAVAYVQGPVTFTVSPPLPAGLSLNAATGVITGTPTNSQFAMSYAITATDVSGRVARATVSIEVGVPGIVPASQTLIAYLGEPMEPSSSFIPRGLTEPVTYSIVPALPAGLSMSPTTGVISGTPTALLGETFFTVTATDSSIPVRTATASVSLEVSVPPVTPPGKVTKLKARAKGSNIIITWQPPRDTGGGVINYYLVKVGKEPWTSHNGFRVKVASPNPGQKVSVRVRAVNEAGAGLVRKVKVRAG